MHLYFSNSIGNWWWTLEPEKKNITKSKKDKEKSCQCRWGKDILLYIAFRSFKKKKKMKKPQQMKMMLENLKGEATNLPQNSAITTAFKAISYYRTKQGLSLD